MSFLCTLMLFAGRTAVADDSGEGIPSPSDTDTWITIVIAVIFVGAIAALNLLGTKRTHQD